MIEELKIEVQRLREEYRLQLDAAGRLLAKARLGFSSHDSFNLGCVAMNLQATTAKIESIDNIIRWLEEKV